MNWWRFFGGGVGCKKGDKVEGPVRMAPDMRGTSSSAFKSCFKLLESFGIVFSRVLTCFDQVREAGPALFGRTVIISSSSSVLTTKEGTGAISSCSIPSMTTKEGVGDGREG